MRKAEALKGNIPSNATRLCSVSAAGLLSLLQPLNLYSQAAHRAGLSLGKGMHDRRAVPSRVGKSMPVRDHEPEPS